MNCQETRENLASYSENELPLAEKGSLERHLQGCRTCTQELARMRKVWPLLQGLSPVEPTAALKSRVMDRIRSKYRISRFAFPLAAAAVLLVAVSVFLMFPGWTGHGGHLAREDEVIQNMDVLMAMDDAEMMELVEDEATLAQLEKVLDLEEVQ